MKYGIVLQAKIDELFIHAVPAFFFSFIVGTGALFYLLSQCYSRCTHQSETTERPCYDMK